VDESGGLVDGSADEDGRSFEELMGELESVTDQLARGEVGIEAAAELYERAQRLHALATARLDAVRQRVERLQQDPPLR
jgi:exodeoxyribonuclease VII small subunit